MREIAYQRPGSVEEAVKAAVQDAAEPSEKEAR